ncbi:cobalamin B12-binding domain-containing protein [Desulfosporosinus nitroreducens]|uniref:Cobalamin-dependent protein n=1 Tax=Desulfosporosinus nitroreducens TaxID=2018668 RepID=A0ABT8QTD6_9FIRM|nr:cobalamin-dependent protein [Desulfosporosinus nitroreducens]MCO1601780.1 cobalamin-dependent protein [Desulfosporosinus nitroreducens]MDO0823323.1 cobalamin-dependent protein [Desulfosporosinus nitroreducens]
MNNLDTLVESVIQGRHRDAVALAEQLLSSGIDVYTIVEHGLSPALKALDVKCTSDEFNLLEIMLAGRAMLEVMNNVIAKHLDQDQPVKQLDTIILGSIKGDIHELGKHVVRILLSCAGYKVIDLGQDVEPKRFVEAAVEAKADYIFISGLISVIVPQVREVRAFLLQQNLTIPVVAGGAALQQMKAEDLNVDYVAKNAFDGLHYVQRMR